MSENDKTILIKELSKNKFEVFVSSIKTTKHIVTISDDVHQNLTKGSFTKKELLYFAFEFLLDREPNTSIMHSFDLMVIANFFQEFEDNVRLWCDL